jgi:hypothetical protein
MSPQVLILKKSVVILHCELISAVWLDGSIRSQNWEEIDTSGFSQINRIRFCRLWRFHHYKIFGSGLPLGPGTLKVKNLYEWFQQCGCRFRVILEWGIRIRLNFQDQAPLDPGTLGAKVLSPGDAYQGLFLFFKIHYKIL